MMFLTIILFCLMLSLIIVIHEGGHFLAAKAFNVYVHEFSLGMGPKIFSKKGKETTYSIRALPIGGFVAMAGDNENDLETKVDIEVPKDRSLNGIHPLKRIIIMISGIVMNLILALVIISLLFLSIGASSVSPEPIIDNVSPGMPADLAGLKTNDRIIKVTYDNGYSISPSDFSELSSFLSLYEGEGYVHFIIERNNNKINIDVKPELNSDDGTYYIGISSSQYEKVDVNFVTCWKYGLDYLISMTKLIFVTLIGLFRGVGLNNLSGPVGIYQVTEEAISYGVSSYISLIALISLNVGIFNALPLPIFDGGRIFLTIIEIIRGKALSKDVETRIMNACAFLLIVLMIFVTFKDIFNLFGR